VSFKPLHQTIGFTRCSICLHDFNINEKLKQFPKCEHLYHIKCLDIWLNIEANCPNCLQFFVQNKTPQEIAAARQVIPLLNTIPRQDMINNIAFNNNNGALVVRQQGPPFGNL